LFRGSYEDVFAYAKNLGFDGVEIHLRDAADVDGRMLKRQSEKYGVAVAAIASGLAKRIDGLSLVDKDESKRQEAIKRIKGHLDLAAEFGCPVVIGSMRDNIPSPDQREWILERLAEAMRQVSDYIENKNCSVAIEAINRYENNYLNTSAELAAFIDRVGAPKIGMLLDSFHMNIEETDNAEAIRAAGARLMHYHVAENTRWYPGQGQTDFSNILHALQEIHYSGWISMEYLPKPNELKAAQKGAEFVQMVKKLYD
jgi:sugar phosphate isomerase/epimerase